MAIHQKKKPDRGSADGSGAFSPMASADQRRRAAAKEVQLDVPDVGGQRLSLKLYDLCLSDLGHSKEKPAKGYLNCPHVRRGTFVR